MKKIIGAVFGTIFLYGIGKMIYWRGRVDEDIYTKEAVKNIALGYKLGTDAEKGKAKESK